MARKASALLNSTPVKLDKISLEILATLDKIKPVPGCETEWNRYLAAVRHAEEQEARYDVIYRQVEKEGGNSSCASWDAFKAAGRASMIATRSAFGSLDTYRYRVNHVDDKVLVPEADVRALVIDSLSDKLEELQFTNNYGMLGSKVAQAIRKDVSEDESGDPAFCADCL